ncbi:MAG: histidine phosphotransferase family protein [Alphaproteobacteria bacterium]
MLSGLELLEDNPGDQEISQLIQTSAEESARRLSFFRLAMGHGVTRSFSTLERVKEPLEKSINPSKISIEWQLTDTAFASSDVSMASRLLAALALCMVEAMPLGGSLSIAATNNLLTITGESRRITLPDEVKTTLLEGSSTDDLSPRAMPAFIAWLAAGELGIKTEVAGDDSRVVFTAAAAQDLANSG